MAKKLRADRNQKSYKRIDYYLKQVYKKNKDYLDTNIDNYVKKQMGVSSEQLFYKTVKEIWKNKEYDETLGRRIKTFDEAIDKAQRSSLISSERHYKELVESQLYKDADAYHSMRKILKTRKFNPDNIEYIGEQSTSDGWESWYKYEYTTYRKYAKVAQRGKNKGQIITAKTKVDKSFYIVYHQSLKSGGGGWYEIIEEPTPEMMKELS